MKSVLTLTALLALSLTASAQTPIGPFTGSISETFDSHPNTTNAGCVPTGIFGNTATICLPSNDGIWITSGWGFNCSLSAMGPRMCGTTGGSGTTGVDITFSAPPSKFGGYFGLNHPGGPDVNVTFYAGSTVVAGPVVGLVPVNCTWNWLGWDLAGTGVDRINVKSNYGASGGFFHMDSLEVDYQTCVTQYGKGCKGSFGLVPVLSSPACAVAGGSATIDVSQGLGGANAILFLGLNQAALPMGSGCTLNVAPLFPVSVSFPLNASGAISLVGSIPPAAAGASITLQAFVVDPGGVGGYSNTNGLQLDIQ